MEWQDHQQGTLSRPLSRPFTHIGRDFVTFLLWVSCKAIIWHRTTYFLCLWGSTAFGIECISNNHLNTSLYVKIIVRTYRNCKRGTPWNRPSSSDEIRVLFIYLSINPQEYSKTWKCIHTYNDVGECIGVSKMLTRIFTWASLRLIGIVWLSLQRFQWNISIFRKYSIDTWATVREKNFKLFLGIKQECIR